VWLVDWEAAFLNDRYADVTVAANLVVASDEDEIAYLREYFGAEPDQYQRARFHLRMWAGEVDLANQEVKKLYGRVHWERFLHNARQTRYKEALRLVTDRHRLS